jgi:hypothetical protein
LEFYILLLALSDEQLQLQHSNSNSLIIIANIFTVIMWEDSLVSKVTGYRLYDLGLITVMGRDFSPHVQTDSEAHPVSTGDSPQR